MDNNISNQNRNQNNSQNNNNMGNNFGRGQNRKSMVLCLLVALGIFLVFSLMNFASKVKVTVTVPLGASGVNTISA